MKFLLVLTVVLVAFWIWRNNRRADLTDKRPPTAAAPRIQDMVACDLCGTHVPAAEVVTGASGRYCCPEHQRQHQRELRQG